MLVKTEKLRNRREALPARFPFPRIATNTNLSLSLHSLFITFFHHILKLSLCMQLSINCRLAETWIRCPSCSETLIPFLIYCVQSNFNRCCFSLSHFYDCNSPLINIIFSSIHKVFSLKPFWGSFLNLTFEAREIQFAALTLFFFLMIKNHSYEQSIIQYVKILPWCPLISAKV